MLVFFDLDLPATKKNIIGVTETAHSQYSAHTILTRLAITERTGARGCGGAVLAAQLRRQLRKLIAYVGILGAIGGTERMLTATVLLRDGAHRFEHMLHLVHQRRTLVEHLIRGHIVVGYFMILVLTLPIGFRCSAGSLWNRETKL